MAGRKVRGWRRTPPTRGNVKLTLIDPLGHEIKRCNGRVTGAGTWNNVMLLGHHMGGVPLRCYSLLASGGRCRRGGMCSTAPNWRGAAALRRPHTCRVEVDRGHLHSILFPPGASSGALARRLQDDKYNEGLPGRGCRGLA